jgi:hypothetical protein
MTLTSDTADRTSGTPGRFNFGAGGLAGLKSPLQAKVEGLTDQELAQALMERLTLVDGNWHQKKSNRAVRAKEQVAAALVYLLKGKPEEALPRLEQAVGWLNRTISAPPCQDHGDSSGSLRSNRR